MSLGDVGHYNSLHPFGPKVFLIGMLIHSNTICNDLTFYLILSEFRVVVVHL